MRGLTGVEGFDTSLILLAVFRRVQRTPRAEQHVPPRERRSEPGWARFVVCVWFKATAAPQHTLTHNYGPKVAI